MKLIESDTLHLLSHSNQPMSGSFLRSYGYLLEPEALFVYQMLKTSDQKEMNLKSFCLECRLNLSQINNAIDKMVHLGLCEIRVSSQLERTIRIQLLEALSLSDVLKHEVLGRSLLKKIGASEFSILNDRVSAQILSDEGYVEYVSEKSELIQNWSQEDELAFQSPQHKKVEPNKLSFDIIAFLNECSPLILPDHKRSEASLHAISEIASVYGLSVKQMIQLVGKAYVKDDVHLNSDKLRKLAAKIEVNDHVEYQDPYDYPPALFLKRLRKGIEASSLEKYLLVKLVSKDGLSPQVLNVLLEFHFNQYQSKINTKALEEVALQWAVMNVRSKEEALAKCQTTKTRAKRAETQTNYDTQAHSFSEAELSAIESALKEIK